MQIEGIETEAKNVFVSLPENGERGNMDGRDIEIHSANERHRRIATGNAAVIGIFAFIGVIALVTWIWSSIKGDE